MSYKLFVLLSTVALGNLLISPAGAKFIRGVEVPNNEDDRRSPVAQATVTRTEAQGDGAALSTVAVSSAETVTVRVVLSLNGAQKDPEEDAQSNDPSRGEAAASPYGISPQLEELNRTLLAILERMSVQPTTEGHVAIAADAPAPNR